MDHEWAASENENVQGAPERTVTSRACWIHLSFEGNVLRAAPDGMFSPLVCRVGSAGSIVVYFSLAPFIIFLDSPSGRAQLFSAT
jgi:hypothetical protein